MFQGSSHMVNHNNLERLLRLNTGSATNWINLWTYFPQLKYGDKTIFTS